MTKGAYEREWRESIENRDAFWAKAAEGIDWFRPWDTVCDTSKAPATRWFVGGEMNTCWNCLDRHVDAGHGDQVAIIHDSPVTQSRRTLTYAELLDLTKRAAGALKAKGVSKGDRVVIYMPMVPEALAAALACARLGAVHSIVFGGFAANELAVRIDDSQAKVVVSASCGIEPTRVVEYKPLLDKAIELARHKPDACIILQRPQVEATLIPGRDTDWEDEIANAEPADCVPVKSEDPLYILYTSGTTGQPKGIVRDNGGHAVALHYSMNAVYGLEPGEVFWTASDIGWVVGHSYILYGPLLHRNTSVLFEGKPVGTPDAGAFWRVCAEHGVVTMFTAPTAIRGIRQQDPDGKEVAKYDLSKLRAFFLAGERCDPNTLEWCQEKLQVPVIDHWWQTETGWPIASNCLGIEQLPVKPGSPTRPVPGWDIRVLDAGGNEAPRNTIGAICAKLPLPPATFQTLWNAHERYVNTYFRNFPGHYETGNSGIMDADGYIHVMARTDDVINVAGHRLSTGGMEEVLADHEAVAECAVVGVADEVKGQRPVGFVVLQAGTNTPPETVVEECIALVRDRIGPVAAFKECMVVPRLPKTRSGKVLRSTIQKIADGVEWKMPATIEDPAALDEISEVLRDMGMTKAG